MEQVEGTFLMQSPTRHLISGKYPELAGATEIRIGIRPVDRPDAPKGITSYEEDLSRWILRVDIDVLGPESKLKSHVTFRSPHDLWRLARTRVGQTAEMLARSHEGTELSELASGMLLCDDERESYELSFSTSGGESIGQVYSKYTGFFFNICVFGSSLLMDCYNGAPGRMTSLSGISITCFNEHYYFPFSLCELLSLPAYVHDMNHFMLWRPLTVDGLQVACGGSGS